jgi:hypothetical protein
MRSGARKVRITFTAPCLTHFAGIYLFQQFLQRLKIRTYFSQHIPYTQRNNDYTLSEMILALVYPMILGLGKIEVSALLKTNGVFQYLTGLPSFPNPTTLRRFLLRTSPELLVSFRETHNALRKYFLRHPSPRSGFCLDFDSTVKTLYGHQEGAMKGYNPRNRGKRSYHPLVATEGHLKDCLGGLLRFGNVSSAGGVIPLFHEIYSILPHASILRTRADAGFYDGKLIEELVKHRVEFAIVADITIPIKHRLPGLCYARTNDLFSVSEFNYQPLKWKQPYRFVVLRRKVPDSPDEKLTLFTLDKYAYSVIVTNLSLTPYGVFNFYKNRAGLERIVRILKNDFPFGSAPTGNFVANTFYAELSLFAYNLIVWFKRICLPKEWQSLTLPKLRHRLFMMPGELVRTGNIPTLKFPLNNPNKEIFKYAQNQIKKQMPLV